MNIIEQIDNKETKLQDTDFPHICRICQSRNNLLAFEEQSSLMGIFKLLTNIEVIANPDMPQNVCNKCISKLQSIENFIAKCIETENMLLRLLPNKQIEIKTEIVEPEDDEPMDTCMIELIKNEIQECEVTTVDEWNMDSNHVQKNVCKTEPIIAAKDDWENRPSNSNIDDFNNPSYSDILNNQEENKTKVIQEVNKTNDTVEKGNHTRKGYCIYCDAEVHHFVKHLERIHIDEPEIELLFSEPPGTIKRKQMILSLRKRGKSKSDLKRDNPNSSETLNIKMPEKASWDAEAMKKALSFIANGGAIRDAGRKFGIPESTIRLRKRDYDRGYCDVTGPQKGRHPVFSQDKEKHLANRVLKIAKLFYGVTRNELRRLAYSYAISNNIPNNFNVKLKMAGIDWYNTFLSRNNELIKTESTIVNRISGFNIIHITEFLTNLKTLYEKYRFRDDQIFNVDETDISTLQNPCKRRGSKGTKKLGAKTSDERGETVTVICCCNAAGTSYVPPVFIFPKAHMTNILKNNGPPNAKYSFSKSGWSNEKLFYQWLQHFKDIVKPSTNEPVLLIMDNHSSHMSVDIYEFCKQNGIELLIFPPGISHRLQPLDISFHDPLKAAFNRQYDNYLLHFEKVTLYNLSEIFHKAYIEVATEDKAQSGFSASGIWPFQPEKFKTEYFLASTHTPAVTIHEEDQQSDAEVQFKVPKFDLITSTLLQANEDLNHIPTHRAGKVQRRARQLTLKKRLKLTEKDKSGSESEPEEEEISVSQLNDDDELDVAEADLESRCLVCDGSSKNENDEYWFQCSVCSRWVHQLCSGVDSPESYICNFCDC
ncbi:uncharacterized protein LOC114325818 isoform X2 [Diabrotica virgifera virgifera]|uniref:ZAD domain-containing protein n=1 Tax=Diabrotica virgifera virgifera TaxID=50390 RepID=A0ABM5JWS9_DIAVI|nr:uncharacterized protein LOC114325818 isoform X2 [Diabrotica virgifera virgifera]